MYVNSLRDLWRASIRRFGDDELEPVALFEYEGDARDFFFGTVNLVRVKDYKISYSIMVCDGPDDVLIRARASVSPPASTSKSWELLIERVDNLAPVTVARGGSYDFVAANAERLF